MSENEKTVNIVDTEKFISKKGINYFWRGHNSPKSILHILEKNSYEIRKRYLQIQKNFASNIFEKISRDKKDKNVQIDLLFSSLLVENNMIKSPCLTDLLRILALEKELNAIECNNLRYIGAEQHVAESLKLLCKNSNINFLWDQMSSPSTDSLLRRLWKWLPKFLRSMIYVFHYTFNYWSLRRADKPNWHKSTDAIFLFSYFIHFDQKASKKGEFNSKHWETLPKVLEQSGKFLNWMFLFLHSPIVPNTVAGQKLINNFNRNNYKKSAYSFVNSYFSLGILIKTLKDYFKSYFYFLLSNKKIENNLLSLPAGWLWPIIREDWRNSIFDNVAIKNILHIHLFDKAISSLPYQKTGLYLCENQGWERIFIKKWREYGHGKLIGVAHSTISYWDMRYFDRMDKMYDIPIPDKIAVNSPKAWETLESAGQDMSQYVKVEAVRYEYLNNFYQSKKYNNNYSNLSKTVNLLVLGDIRQDTTESMLKDLEKVFLDIKDKYVIKIKPHPANPVDLNEYPKLNAEIININLKDLLSSVDLVFTSVFTSSVLDAFCSGIRVISYLDPNNLNYSLLRDFNGAEFVSSSGDLLQSLKEEKKDYETNLSKPENFFWLNSNLDQWKGLLGLDH